MVVRLIFGGEFSQEMLAVTAGGPGLVAVGRDSPSSRYDSSYAAVWVSPDGIAWSRVPHDEAVFGGEGRQGISAVTAGGPGLVAYGSAMWTSPDGVTWSRFPRDEVGLGGGALLSVTAGGPGFVAVGYTTTTEYAESGIAVVWTSSDGITWNRVPHDEAVFGGSEHQQMLSVTAGGPGLVAVGVETSRGDEDAAVWTSPDGITWARYHNRAVFGGSGNQRLAAVVTGPGGWSPSDMTILPREPMPRRGSGRRTNRLRDS